jgi:hypothetical protein
MLQDTEPEKNWDDPDDFRPTDDEWDIVVLGASEEERYIYVPSDYWKTKRGKAVAALLRAQGKRKFRRTREGRYPA